MGHHQLDSLDESILKLIAKQLYYLLNFLQNNMNKNITKSL